LERLAIIAKVNNPEKFYSEATYSPNKEVKAHFIIKTDKQLFDSIINEFQEIESLLALQYSIKNIRWDKPKHNLICETDEEREKVSLNNIMLEKQFRNEPTEASTDSLADCIKRKENLQPVIIPLSFYREGVNDFKSFKYINAFFNFYFVLEGLFGKGKTKNYQVEQEFNKSYRFRRNVLYFLVSERKNNSKHYQKLSSMLKSKNKTVDVDSLIWLIVSTRGDLHHFTNNLNRFQGTPFTHEHFESIAFFLMHISIQSIFAKIVDINKGKA
jgi:hypothetical protein